MEKISKSLEEMWMRLHVVSLTGISVSITCLELILNDFADYELSPPFNVFWISAFSLFHCAVFISDYLTPYIHCLKF